MKKAIILIFLSTLGCKCDKPLNAKIQTNICLAIEDIKDGFSESKMDNDYINNAIFMEKLTGIESELSGDNLGFIQPSKKTIMLWEKWLIKNEIKCK